jgi:hypothetical protein
MPIIIIIIITGFLSSGTFPLEPVVHPPPHSGFKFYIVALSLLCAVSLVLLLFVESLLDDFLVFFIPLVTISVTPVTTGIKKHFIFHIC